MLQVVMTGGTLPVQLIALVVPDVDWHDDIRFVCPPPSHDANLLPGVR